MQLYDISNVFYRVVNLVPGAIRLNCIGKMFQNIFGLHSPCQ